MSPLNNAEVGVDVPSLQTLMVPSLHSQHPRRNSVIPVTVSDDAFVVDCDDIEIVKTSPSFASTDDGISMDFSIGPDGEAKDVESGIFMTESSAIPNPYNEKHPTINHPSLHRGSVANVILGICKGGGGPEDNGGGDKGSIASLSKPSLRAGDSRASLISLKKHGRKDESWGSILSQIGLPFLIAGLGMVGAGLLLDYVMGWVVFVEIGELVVLVTPLLGLKGNLEMTLAARLSTHANIGNLDKATGKKWTICSGNLILDQLQAIVCGFAASFIAIIVGYLFTGKFEVHHMSLVVVSSVLTASMVSVILGSTMVSVILISKKFKVNPDNIACPVAGSLGDVVTLGMLSCFASIIYRWHNDGHVWVPYVIIGFYALCLPLCFWLAFKNEYTRPVTISGWIPLLVSVSISTGGGIMLDLATSRFPGVALYQPVINGIGGNLVSVQASRISSYYHGNCEKRLLPNNGRICESPCSVYFKKEINSMSARLLLLLAIPGHLLFSTLTHFLAAHDDTNYGPLFLFVYVSAAVIQVTILLYIAKVLTNLCWTRGVDPDTATIPYLTAMGDFFGSGLLFMAFELLSVIDSSAVV